MITVPLTFRYSPRPIRKTEAWYIASSDPALWLAEATSWSISHKSIQILPVSRSATDRKPCGALVTASAGTPLANRPTLCVPYGKIADRLYLPVEAWLDPDVSDDELQSLLSDGYTYVWHPTPGLVAFEPTDIQQISDLLTIGSSLSRRWDRAQPGVVIARRLISLLPEEVPGIDRILEQGQDDIGTQSDELTQLPPSPMEPEPGVMNATSRQGKRMLANIVHWITQRIPATSDEPTWINRLEEWAQKNLAEFYSGLNSSRHKELTRLMHLLETDPDQGLRFALPIGGDAHRGIAPSSGQLAERSTDFRLSSLGGGQMADFWDLSADYQHRLIKRYRELADREIQLGRHRRAAYIYAELLADFHSAAGALVDGHHWREAAVLYRERLDSPLDAARCLEQGGLWTEAIELYEQLQQHEKAGDLHIQLEQHDSARQQYQKAVDRHRNSGDILSAARLLENKLDLVEEALQELSFGWPNSSQASQCLREMFQMLGRLGRHDSATAQIQLFQEQALPERNRVELVDILADTATRYPDRAVQANAADCTRTLVSRQLPQASKSSARRLLAAISQLVPEDRLLGRDCQRYLRQQPVPAKPDSPKRIARNTGIRVVRAMRMPGINVIWKEAILSGRTIFAAGVRGDKLILNRSSWEAADPQGLAWGNMPQLHQQSILLASSPHRVRDNSVFVHAIGSPPLSTEQSFVPTDACPTAAKAGPIRGVSEMLLGATITAHGFVWLVEYRGDELTLIALGPGGEQVSSQTILAELSPADFDESVVILPTPLHACSAKVYLGISKHLLIMDKTQPQTTIALEQPITSIVGSAPNTRVRIAVTMERGGTLYWDDIERGESTGFASDMPRPIVAFNQGGYLIAASEGCCEVYSTHNERIRLENELIDKNLNPIAVLPGPRSDQFGIVSKSGIVTIYEISGATR